MPSTKVEVLNGLCFVFRLYFRAEVVEIQAERTSTIGKSFYYKHALLVGERLLIREMRFDSDERTWSNLHLSCKWTEKSISTDLMANKHRKRTVKFTYWTKLKYLNILAVITTRTYFTPKITTMWSKTFMKRSYRWHFQEHNTVQNQLRPDV